MTDEQQDRERWTFTRADLAAAFAARLGPDWEKELVRRQLASVRGAADVLEKVGEITAARGGEPAPARGGEG